MAYWSKSECQANFISIKVGISDSVFDPYLLLGLVTSTTTQITQ